MTCATIVLALPDAALRVSAPAAVLDLPVLATITISAPSASLLIAKDCT